MLCIHRKLLKSAEQPLTSVIVQKSAISLPALQKTHTHTHISHVQTSTKKASGRSNIKNLQKSISIPIKKRQCMLSIPFSPSPLHPIPSYPILSYSQDQRSDIIRPRPLPLIQQQMRFEEPVVNLLERVCRIMTDFVEQMLHCTCRSGKVTRALWPVA